MEANKPNQPNQSGEPNQPTSLEPVAADAPAASAVAVDLQAPAAPPSAVADASNATSDSMDAPAEVAVLSGSIGKRFRAAREAKQLSVSDIANRLKRSVRQIEALEAEDYPNLPGATHLRGFVRVYARALDLSPETMVALLPMGSTPSVATPIEASATRQPARHAESLNPRRLDAPFPQPGEQRMADRGWLMAALAIVLLVGGYGLYAWLVPAKPKSASPTSAPAIAAKSAESAESATIAPTRSPLSTPAQTPAPAAVSGTEPAGIPVPVLVPQAEWQTDASTPGDAAASAGGKLRMVFANPSWVQVNDATGKVVHQRTHKAGDEQMVSGTPPFALIVGKAKGVRIYFDGKQIDLAPHITESEIARLSLP